MENEIPSNFSSTNNKNKINSNIPSLYRERNSYSWSESEDITIKVPIKMEILQFDKLTYKKKILKKYLSQKDFYNILLRGDRRLARAHKVKKDYEKVKLDGYVYFLSICSIVFFIFLMALLYYAPRHESGFILQMVAVIMAFLGVLFLFLLEFLNIKRPLKEGKTLEDFYYYPVIAYCQEINMEVNKNLFFEFCDEEKCIKIHVKCSEKEKEKFNESEDEEEGGKSSGSENSEGSGEKDCLYEEREDFEEKEEEEGNEIYNKIRSKTAVSNKNKHKNLQRKFDLGNNRLMPIKEKPEKKFENDINKEKENVGTLTLPFLSSQESESDKDSGNNLNSDNNNLV